MPHSSGSLTPTAQSRSFLMLQGLATPFFGVLAEKLLTAGHGVHKVNFCGGDRLFMACHKPQPSMTNHYGPQQALPDLYLSLIKEHAITDIILFGDCRPIHKMAIMVANDHKIPVHVFEEGYTRPNWVTLETGGTNGHSPLPKTIAGIQACLAKAHKNAPRATDHAPLPNPMIPRIRMDFMFHAANIFGMAFFRGYKTHRPERVSDELRGWAMRLWRKYHYRRMNAALLMHYHQRDTAFFLVPLQLNSDFQIREHSSYKDVPDFIREVIASFAHHAPARYRLLFKSHPLDNGMIDYRAVIRQAGEKHRVTDMLDYVEGGDLPVLLEKAAGVVLINSTVGYAALQAGKPVKVMGRALYDMPGLTDQAALDAFWQHPAAPDTGLVTDFIRLVRTESQLYGDFFTRPGIELAATAAVHKLLNYNK